MPLPSHQWVALADIAGMRCLKLVLWMAANPLALSAIFFSVKVYAKKQGIQDSIANGKYPNYKDTMRRNLILKLNL